MLHARDSRHLSGRSATSRWLAWCCNSTSLMHQYTGLFQYLSQRFFCYKLQFDLPFIWNFLSFYWGFPFICQSYLFIFLEALFFAVSKFLLRNLTSSTAGVAATGSPVTLATYLCLSCFLNRSCLQFCNIFLKCFCNVLGVITELKCYPSIVCILWVPKLIYLYCIVYAIIVSCQWFAAHKCVTNETVDGESFLSTLQK